MIDLLDIIPEELASTPDYCSRQYWVWEQNVAKPALESLGYSVGPFYDGEVDSCGPLSRTVTITKDGVKQECVYG